MSTVNRKKLKAQLEIERKRFVENHPGSMAAFERAKSSLFDGVPMPWMTEWPYPFPIFMKAAAGAHIVDVDGIEYIDFCLGDTGAMTGHSPKASMDALVQQARKGLTFMCPTDDAIWVGETLSRRFGLPFWQIAMTATDANRFCIRLARHITGRKKILVYNYCYHGTVDEAQIILTQGVPGPRKGNVGAPVNPVETTRVVEFNDLEALEKALADEDVACVLAEPAMTNIGIIHPDPGYHEALRDITRKTGTLLILDETHTISSGVGGYTREHGLQPDMLTVGKTIASGFPAAAYGFSEAVADLIRTRVGRKESSASDETGIGGTLSGNALAIATIRATLEKVLNEAFYEYAIPLAVRFNDGVQGVIEALRLPWTVARLGCRTEYWFCEKPVRNGSEALAAVDDELDHYMHLSAMNRRILMTPFHNMALISSATSREDIDCHTRVFRECVEAVVD
ncbi:MAG: aspartate aminotransferase family protein [Deltaproteobacteria bacterium]|nr:aspartate aminotransferase family protein [Deltaproteobacteria bacterium]